VKVSSSTVGVLGVQAARRRGSMGGGYTLNLKCTPRRADPHLARIYLVNAASIKVWGMARSGR
jgi:hypothetical protein